MKKNKCFFFYFISNWLLEEIVDSAKYHTVQWKDFRNRNGREDCFITISRLLTRVVLKTIPIYSLMSNEIF